MDASLPLRIDDAEHAWRVLVDAVGFACEGQVAALLAFFPVCQGFDVTQAVEPFDADLTYIADGEIGVQRLADHHRFSAAVVADQTDIQCVVQTNAQFQGDVVRPARQVAFGLGKLKTYR